jgi:peptidoglycan hydrolase CwlO-like protein
MKRGIIGLILALAFVAAAGVAGGLVPASAQTVESVEARRARLEAELAAEELAIAAQLKLLDAKQRETATVSGEIDLLKSKIAKAQTNIKAKRLAIERLTDEILARQGKIEVLEGKIKEGQASLSELLRKTRDGDSATFAEILLGYDNLSDFFGVLDDYAFVQKAIHQSVADIRGAQAQAADEKVALEDRKNKEIDAEKEIEYQRQLIAKQESEKQALLAIGKSEEKEYQRVLSERQKRAAEIRAALFALRDAAAIPFGKALEYATEASRKTGVRPAFVLAILQQESNLGQNVGSCVITNLQTGETRSVNSGTVFKNGIHPTRDLPLLQTILSELGRDPLMTNVSCPLSIGYGGAMGPAQFIPSTWQLMKSKIAVAVGKAVADPWDPRDAFMASALYLGDLGAGAGGYTAEVNAACRYYSGRACNAGPGASYGNQVMAKANNIQLNMINPLQNAN